MKGILWAVPTRELKCPDPKHPNHPEGSSLHHVTLQFNVEREGWEHLIDREFSAHIQGRCWNNLADALFVRLPKNIPCQNAHPHLTVSWAEGAGPVDSNKILGAGGEWPEDGGAEGVSQWWGGFELSLRIEFKEFG